MPTIEIVSVECKYAPDFGNYSSFRVVYELGELKSHRGLFQNVFDQHRGLIVHLGNNSLPAEPGPWFADELIDWKKVDAIAPVGSHVIKPCIFKKSVKLELKRLLSDLLIHSPIKQVTFSTDYQFTDNPVQEIGPITMSEFAELLERDAIPFNTLFWITAG